MPLFPFCFGKLFFTRHKTWVGSSFFRKPFCSHPISHPWPSIFPLKASCIFPTQLLSRFLSLVLGKSYYEELICILLFQLCVGGFSDSVELPHLQCEDISAVISPFHTFFLSSANDLKVRSLLPTGPEAGFCLFGWLFLPVFQSEQHLSFHFLGH